MENVLAFPFLGILLALTAMVPVRWTLSIVPAILVGAGLGAGWRQWSRPGKTLPRWAYALVGAAFLPWHAGPRPATPYLELASLHLVSMAMTAFATALMVDLVRAKLGPTGGLLAGALFLVGSPALFWGLNAKYHGIGIALVAVAMWCYQEGAATPPGRTFLAFAVAGLAAFNNFSLGVLLLLPLGLVALGALRLPGKALAARGTAGVVGLAVGVLPDRFYTWAVRRAGFQPFHLPSVGADGLHAQRGLGSALWNDPVAATHAIWQNLVYMDWMSSYALAFVSLAPWCVLAVVSALSPAMRARIPRGAALVGTLHAIAVLAFVGSDLVRFSAGYDPRYAATLWPPLVLLASPALFAAWENLGPRRFTTITGVAGGLATTAALVINAVVHAAGRLVTRFGNIHDEVVVHRVTGLAVGADILLVFFWKSRRSDWLPLLAAMGVGLAMSYQVLLQLAFTNRLPEGPFSAWPIHFVAQFVYWMLFS